MAGRCVSVNAEFAFKVAQACAGDVVVDEPRDLSFTQSHLALPDSPVDFTNRCRRETIIEVWQVRKLRDLARFFLR